MEINLFLSMTASQRFLHHFSLLCSDYEGTIKYVQVCPALEKKKKRMFTTFTCKTQGVGEKEGEWRVDFGTNSLW